MPTKKSIGVIDLVAGTDMYVYIIFTQRIIDKGARKMTFLLFDVFEKISL